MPVKPSYIKDIGNILLNRYPEVFNTSFENNKEKVDRLTSITSKTIRNRVAGYICKKVKQKNQKADS